VTGNVVVGSQSIV